MDSVREIARALRGHESGLLGRGARFIVGLAQAATGAEMGGAVHCLEVRVDTRR
ncbi:MAG TPA: hypothetical protein VK730_01680 [Solirubrobacteraceae bacterium]|nr:hypothetical protein [Solirubrobacteraceae bacterium]